MSRAGLRCSRAAAGAALALQAALAAGEARIEPSFGERWVAAGEALVLGIDAATFAARSELRVFVGSEDVTAWLTAPEPGLLRLEPRGGPWPAGEQALVLYRVAQRQWQELARLPLKVLSPAGFEASRFTPRAELQSKGRADEDRSDGAATSPRGTYLDLAGRFGGSWQGAREGWQFEAQANVQATSHRPEALRAAELRDAAPRVDLADYRLAAAHGDDRFEFGHVSHGRHPLLVNGMASRGAALAAQMGGRFDLAAAAMNGTAIVGYHNPTGLEEQDHRVHALTVGAELLTERPGALRAELTLLDAALLPRSGFDQGSVADAERSRGFGVRLLARSAGGRARADLAWARSRHLHPFDPLLAQAGESVAVRAATRDAHRVELSFDLLEAGGEQPRQLALSLLHERTAPLYRSLAAAFASDQMHTRVALSAAWRGATAQLQAAERVDNLARIPTLLRTGTGEWAASVSLPLPAWFGAGDRADSGWPQLSGSWQQVHQRARNAPDTLASGIAASHRPDQLNRSGQLALAWQRKRGSFGYTLTWSDQDNRQSGRERADFRNLGHQLSAAWSLGEALRLNAGAQRSRQLAREQALIRYVNGLSIGADWQALERLALAAQWSLNLQDNSAASATQRAAAAHLQATWRFELPTADRKLPGQAFVRYARQHDRQRDLAFGTASALEAWWVDLGLSVAY
jgi:hypothetical protein